MIPTREFELLEAGTRKHLGTLTWSEPAMPGDLVLRFRMGEIQLEVLPPQPAFVGVSPGVHDERGARRAKAKKPA